MAAPPPTCKEIQDALNAAATARAFVLPGPLDILGQGAKLDAVIRELRRVGAAQGCVLTEPVFDPLSLVLTQVGRLISDALASLGTAVVDGLRGLVDAAWRGLQIGFEVLMNVVLKPILDAIVGALEAAAQGVKELARSFYDALRAMAPHSPQGALDAGLVALGLAAGFQIVAAGAATALDALHPFHSLEVKQLVFEAFRSTGVSQVGPAVFAAIFDVAIAKPMRQELNEQFVREIPGPSDLVRFVVREQISPEELELHLRRQGFGPKWSTAFWGSHWVLPSREEAVDLYHRGRYDLQAVTDNLVLNDRKPDTIADLIALTFRTPSRAELERLVEVEDVPADQLDAWLRADGISDELLPVYRGLVRGRRRIRILTRVEALVRSEIRAGRMAEREARELMATFRFAPEVIDLEVTVASRERELETRDEFQKIAVEGFRKGQLVKSELAEELLGLGLDLGRVGTIVALEEIRKLPKPRTTPTGG